MKRFVLLLAALLSVVACSPRLAPGSTSSEGTAFMPRPEGFAERYAREEMVILSRHNIRSPLSGPGSVLSRITPHECAVPVNLGEGGKDGRRVGDHGGRLSLQPVL